MFLLIAILVYLVLALIAVILDQATIGYHFSAKTKDFIDDFVHLVFFDSHYFF